MSYLSGLSIETVTKTSGERRHNFAGLLPRSKDLLIKVYGSADAVVNVADPIEDPHKFFYASCLCFDIATQVPIAANFGLQLLNPKGDQHAAFNGAQRGDVTFNGAGDVTFNGAGDVSPRSHLLDRLTYLADNPTVRDAWELSLTKQ
jgi:hypothetical protein